MPVQTQGSRSKGPWYFPGSYWFPVATAYAALALPWSVLGQLGMVPAPPGLQGGLGHAHEMLFGFALAVVAGYTLPPGRKRWPVLLLLVWAAARLAFLLAPATWPALVLNGLFVTGLALLVAPTYLRASKWSNRSVALVVIALALAAVTYHVLGQVIHPAGRHTVMLGAVLLLSVLMYFMGGRILAPAIAGYARSKGPPLRHVVQPGLENLTLVLLATAVVCLLLPGRGAELVAAASLVASALLTLVRVLRWRAWLCHDQPDLLALLVGYAWLVAGWLLVASALMTHAAPTRALHAITVGALGTLTSTVILRTQMFRATRDTNHFAWAYLSAALLAVAAVLRIGGTGPWQLAAAALCWALSYAVLCALLIHLHGHKRPQLQGRHTTDR